MPSQLTLVLGGIRSGKSAFAEKLARDLDKPTLYVATGLPTDAEMERRISHHRERRPQNWATVEEPIDLAGGLTSVVGHQPTPEAVLVDSLDHWVSNVLLQHENSPADEVDSLILSSVEDILQACGKLTGNVFMVGLVNQRVAAAADKQRGGIDTGCALLAGPQISRQDELLGLVNQRVAAAADNVYLVVAGIPVVGFFDKRG